jgi:CBS domain-containing protein
MSQPRVAKDIMVTRLVTLPPQTCVLDGITLILKNDVSGAPVVSDSGEYLGVFSEKCCMNVLSEAARQVRAGDPPVGRIPARDFMVTKLVTLQRDMDVFDAIGYLLRNHISGAPVIDSDRTYYGVFSEKTSMRVLIQSAYEQMPTTTVDVFMDTDFGRTVSRKTDLLSIAQTFRDTHYRRLPVLHAGKLSGQISRRDVLRAKHDIFGQSAGRIRIGSGDGELLSEATLTTCMDTHAKTITEDADLLSIAHTFLSTPYRRLPVVRDGKLVGQVSRRDLLLATHSQVIAEPQRTKAVLYLSSLMERSESPFG